MKSLGFALIITITTYAQAGEFPTGVFRCSAPRGLALTLSITDARLGGKSLPLMELSNEGGNSKFRSLGELNISANTKAVDIIFNAGFNDFVGQYSKGIFVYSGSNDMTLKYAQEVYNCKR